MQNKDYSKYIYLDNAATTRVNSEVLEKMLPYLTSNYANPSSIYRFASDMKADLEDFREIVADSINAKLNEIYFTSGGTESDNWALRMIAKSFCHKGKHIITTKIEHDAVLKTCEALEKEGFLITYLDVNKDGIVNINDLREAIRDDTILISIMFANNEIGSIQPIKEIGKIARENNIYFHTDAVQAYTKLDIDVNDMNIDLLSASGHKIHAPKGVGFLYIRSGIKIKALLTGGGQERKRRAGTENMAGIAGLAAAVSFSQKHKKEHLQYISKLRDYMLNRILKEIDKTKLNGSIDKRLAGNLNISFEGISSEILLIELDNAYICASAGSACSTGSMSASHVLMALGQSNDEALCGIRFSLEYENTYEEIDYTVDLLKKSVERIRRATF